MWENYRRIYLNGLISIARRTFGEHSLSVSDIVVLNNGEKVTAHFVDSISFQKLDNFLDLEEHSLDELAYQVGERYFVIQVTEEASGRWKR